MSARMRKSWVSMVQRCHNENAPDFSRYGGRGIRVAPRWHQYQAFLSDMGERPVGTSLDVNGGYEPGNCRWASPADQARNRCNNKLDTASATQIRWLCSDGAFAQSEVAKAFGIHPSMVSRIASGHYWR